MDIQPIVIGTAGHIDHGKSTLVRALTGIDPDRLKEEKERGLTIDLGFAPLTMPDGRLVGIVDVPGHERFIKNMVAGASGIDLVVLVVAADDGVMPQTREHLDIMGLLGVERGFIALTKVDAVDPEMVELAAEDVRETVEGTFLEGAPILEVSAIEGTGVEALRAHLFELAAEAAPRSDEGVFRMPVQRVFSARGFGTIVTGIPVAGTLKTGQSLEVLPGGQRGKVRGIQAYKQTTTTARAGHSTAINLADVDHKEVGRGHVVCEPGYFKPLRMFGARFRTLPSLGFSISDRTRVRLHLGTAELVGELVLLDREELAAGEDGLVQVRLQDPVVCAPNDRFILRLESPMVTLGGGTVLEESRYRLKRNKGFVLDELERQEQSLETPKELLASLLQRHGLALVAETELAVELKREKSETHGLLLELVEEDRVAQVGPPGRWVHRGSLEEGLGRVRATIEACFGDAPLRTRIDILELRQRSKIDATLLQALLTDLERLGELVLEPGGRIAPVGRRVELTPTQGEQLGAMRSALEAGAFQPPTPKELAADLGVSEGEIAELLAHLVDESLAAKVQPELYLDGALFARARDEVVQNCERNGHLEIPELRDALGTTRKFLIPLLECLDALGVTIRQGGHRVLKRR